MESKYKLESLLVFWIGYFGSGLGWFCWGFCLYHDCLAGFQGNVRL